MPKDREFKDSRGLRGISYLPATKININTSFKKNPFQFEIYDAKKVRVYLPSKATVLISKKNGIRLAHWLLARCTE